jgi:RNA polymerase sigma factor (sigma-70 family)
MNPLTDEQRALAAKWVPFAVRQATDYAARMNYLNRFDYVDAEELRSAALFAAAEAAQRFDPTRAGTMGALLGLMIRQKLHTEVCRQKARGFSRLAGNLANRRTLFDELPMRYGFDSPVGDGVTVADLLPGKADDSDKAEDLRRLEAAIATLPTRHRDIVRRRLAGDTLRVIAADYGVCKERVRQLEVAAHEMLSEMMAGRDPFVVPCGVCLRAFPLTPLQIGQRSRGRENYCSAKCSTRADRIREYERRKARRERHERNRDADRGTFARRRATA